MSKIVLKNMNYELLSQVESICKNTDNKISMLSNLSACLNQSLNDINWVGFYLYTNNKLILGPFQGKIACTEIPIGKGVCGTSFEKKMMLNVKNVHQFVGHIACDSNTNSEIVIPLQYDNKLYGVLDIDSISYSRFSKEDEETLEKIAKMISTYL